MARFRAIPIAVLLSCVPLTSMPAAALAAGTAPGLSGPGAAFGAAPWAPLVLRGGMADAVADAAADAMADELADAAGDDEMMTGEEEEEEGERSENPLRDLIDEGCAAWDEDNDAERAERAFQQALALDPTSPDALCSMGVLMHESGRDLKAAAAYFAKSIESSPVQILKLYILTGMYVANALGH
jgi:tetratricopeptide (TPR) repeat protein